MLVWLRVPVLVDTATTQASGTLVLLDGRLGPSTKSGKVSCGCGALSVWQYESRTTVLTERGIVVVVCVPERHAGTTVPITHNRDPLRFAGVDAQVNTYNANVKLVRRCI